MQSAKKIITAFFLFCSTALFGRYPISGKGNGLDKHNLPKAIIYGYAANLVVAQVENAAFNEVAYTSFEDNTSGNWSFPSSGIQSEPGINGVTGTKYYTLTSSGIRKFISPFPMSKLIVSYWSRSGAQTVNGSSSAQAGKTVTIDGHNWTFYEHVLNSSSFIFISGTGTIDELRLYPEDASMISYTYEPMVGVTSECDLNNNITYYEYDIFKRLSLVRDADYKIVKKYCYGIAGQQEDCTGQIFYSVAKSANFQRSDCASGLVPETVTYTVPAGTYVSTVDQQTADQMAQDDLNASGQIYANINGACNIIHYSDNYSGNYYSQNCLPGETPEPIYVSVPAGMFTSFISEEAANQQALQYAQNYANSYGTCSSNITLYYDCWISGVTFYVTLHNVSTNQNTYFEIWFTGNGVLGTIPEGYYNIQISNSSGWSSYGHEVGCGNYQYGTIANFNNVYLEQFCDLIYIY